MFGLDYGFERLKMIRFEREEKWKWSCVDEEKDSEKWSESLLKIGNDLMIDK